MSSIIYNGCCNCNNYRVQYQYVTVCSTLILYLFSFEDNDLSASGIQRIWSAITERNKNANIVKLNVIEIIVRDY